MELVFYTNPMSRGRIVRWMLEEIGYPYHTELLDFSIGATKTAEYLAINPMGKVPAVRYGTTVVSETAAIVAYLADTFPEAGLAPLPTDPRRGAYFRWLFFAAGPLEAAITNKRFGFTIPPEKTGFCGYGSYAAVMDMMEYAVTRSPYLTGEQFTAADVYCGAMLGFGLRFDLLDKRPAFETYWAQISTRPAALRAAEIDDALLPKAA
jgi:glutathione S-transferase